jgi:hypothetical protein
MAVSLQKPFDVADDYHALAFVIQQLLTRVATVTLVKVVACTNAGGVSPYGFVDVIPLVNQVTGDSQSVPHGTLYRLPYARLQGGTNAIILDPNPNDIGLAAFCARDISAVKADPAAAIANANAGKGGAPPGSARMYDMADGLYIGGFLNGTPEQYIQFNTEGVTVLSPTKVRVEAPTIELVGEVLQSGGNVTMAADLQVDGTVHADVDVIADNISGVAHAHTSASPGNPTSPPLP